MVELNFDRHRPAGAARPDPGRRAGRVGRATATCCGSAPASPYTPDHRRARRPAARAWRWPRARSARRRSATAARSAATSARPRRPATRTRRCSPADAVVELASVRGTRRVPVARVLHRRQAQRAGARRADRGGAGAAGDRAAAVRQGRHPQRDGDRGRARSRSRCDPAARRVGTGIGSAAPTPLRAPEAEEFLAGELAWDEPRPGAGDASRPGSASWSPRPPRRSTTCAAPPPTGGTRSRCWPAAPSAGPGHEYRRGAA